MPSLQALEATSPFKMEIFSARFWSHSTTLIRIHLAGVSSTEWNNFFAFPWLLSPRSAEGLLMKPANNRGKPRTLANLSKWLINKRSAVCKQSECVLKCELSSLSDLEVIDSTSFSICCLLLNLVRSSLPYVILSSAVQSSNRLRFVSVLR